MVQFCYVIVCEFEVLQLEQVMSSLSGQPENPFNLQLESFPSYPATHSKYVSV